LALIIHRIWQKLGFKIHIFLAWFITFNFINIAWIFFRANTFESALKVLKGMFFGELILPSLFSYEFIFFKEWGGRTGEWSKIYGNEVMMWLWFLMAFIITLFLPNSMQWKNKFKTNYFYMILTVFFFSSIFMLYRKSEFIYFNF